MLLQLFNEEGDFAVLINIISMHLSLSSAMFAGEQGSQAR